MFSGQRLKEIEIAKGMSQGKAVMATSRITPSYFSPGKMKETCSIKEG